MDALQELRAIEDIKRLRTRYCRLIDAHRWSELGEILTEDADLDVSPASERLRGPDGRVPRIEGRANIVKFCESRYGSHKSTLHVVSLPEISFDSDIEARGIWRQQTSLKDSMPTFPGSGLAFGTVYDRYLKHISRGWLIRSVRVTLDMMF